MKRLNENDMAKEVTLIEGLKQPISIAQAKELIHIVRDYLATKAPSAVMEWVERSQ